MLIRGQIIGSLALHELGIGREGSRCDATVLAPLLHLLLALQ